MNDGISMGAPTRTFHVVSNPRNALGRRWLISCRKQSALYRAHTAISVAETKELVAGFWMWQCKSKDEAIAWVKRVPTVPGAETTIEIRQVFEAVDFGAELTPEVRAQERRLRARLQS